MSLSFVSPNEQIHVASSKSGTLGTDSTAKALESRVWTVCEREECMPGFEFGQQRRSLVSQRIFEEERAVPLKYLSLFITHVKSLLRKVYYVY